MNWDFSVLIQGPQKADSDCRDYIKFYKKNGDHYSTTKFVTLEDALITYKNMKFNLDLKQSGMAEKLVKIIKFLIKISILIFLKYFNTFTIYVFWSHNFNYARNSRGNINRTNSCFY